MIVERRENLMNEREQLATSKAYTSKRFVVRGDFGAMALGELQAAKRHVSQRVCRDHTWVMGKWTRLSGKSELRNPKTECNRWS